MKFYGVNMLRYVINKAVKTNCTDEQKDLVNICVRDLACLGVPFISTTVKSASTHCPKTQHKFCSATLFEYAVARHVTSEGQSLI